MRALWPRVRGSSYLTTIPKIAFRGVPRRSLPLPPCFGIYPGKKSVLPAWPYVGEYLSGRLTLKVGPAGTGSLDSATLGQIRIKSKKPFDTHSDFRIIYASLFCSDRMESNRAILHRFLA
jgi:hypothetical protein